MESQQSVSLLRSLPLSHSPQPLTSTPPVKLTKQKSSRYLYYTTTPIPALHRLSLRPTPRTSQVVLQYEYSIYKEALGFLSCCDGTTYADCETAWHLSGHPLSTSHENRPAAKLWRLPQVRLLPPLLLQERTTLPSPDEGPKCQTWSPDSVAPPPPAEPRVSINDMEEAIMCPENRPSRVWHLYDGLLFVPCL